MKVETTITPTTQSVASHTAADTHVSGRHSMITYAVIGSFLGLMWAASLRGWMVLLASGFGERPQLTWEGTFLGILLPAALVGALLGGAEHARITRGSKLWRWAILSPLLLAIAPAIVTENFFTILFTTGMGGGAIGVALIGVLGGYAVAGRGLWWARGLSGLLGSVFIVGNRGPLFWRSAGTAVHCRQGIRRIVRRTAHGSTGCRCVNSAPPAARFLILVKISSIEAPFQSLFP